MTIKMYAENILEILDSYSERASLSINDYQELVENTIAIIRESEG